MTSTDAFVYLQERIQLETARLYKLAGINPLAGTDVASCFSLNILMFGIFNSLLLMSGKVLEMFLFKEFSIWTFGLVTEICIQEWVQNYVITKTTLPRGHYERSFNEILATFVSKSIMVMVKK